MDRRTCSFSPPYRGGNYRPKVNQTPPPRRSKGPSGAGGLIRPPFPPPEQTPTTRKAPRNKPPPGPRYRPEDGGPSLFRTRRPPPLLAPITPEARTIRSISPHQAPSSPTPRTPPLQHLPSSPARCRSLSPTSFTITLPAGRPTPLFPGPFLHRRPPHRQTQNPAATPRWLLLLPSPTPRHATPLPPNNQPPPSLPPPLPSPLPPPFPPSPLSSLTIHPKPPPPPFLSPCSLSCPLSLRRCTSPLPPPTRTPLPPQPNQQQMTATDQLSQPRPAHHPPPPHNKSTHQTPPPSAPKGPAAVPSTLKPPPPPPKPPFTPRPPPPQEDPSPPGLPRAPASRPILPPSHPTHTTNIPANPRAPQHHSPPPPLPPTPHPKTPPPGPTPSPPLRSASSTFAPPPPPPPPLPPPAHLGVLDFQDPGAMLELVASVEFRVIGRVGVPHFPEDF